MPPGTPQQPHGEKNPVAGPRWKVWGFVPAIPGLRGPRREFHALRTDSHAEALTEWRRLLDLGEYQGQEIELLLITNGDTVAPRLWLRCPECRSEAPAWATDETGPTFFDHHAPGGGHEGPRCAGSYQLLRRERNLSAWGVAA